MAGDSDDDDAPSTSLVASTPHAGEGPKISVLSVFGPASLRLEVVIGVKALRSNHCC